MNNYKNEVQSSNYKIGTAILYLLVGALFVIFQSYNIIIAFYVFGGLLALAGILLIVRKFLSGGIAMLIFAALVICGGVFFPRAMMIIVGIFVLLKGIADLFLTLNEGSPLGIVFSAITLTIGICLIVGNAVTGNIVDWIYFVIGAVLIAAGIIALIQGLKMKKEGKIKTVDVKDIK